MLSSSNTQLCSVTVSLFIFIQTLFATPQSNGITELKKLNNVSGVSEVVTTTEDATSKTDNSQYSQINSTVLESPSSTVTNSTDNTIEDKFSTNAETSTSNKVEQEPKPESNTIVKNVPTGHSFKSYTNYKLLNSNTPQGYLQAMAYSDENGLRKVGEYYCVALGSYYGTTIGDCYIVTLSSGNTFKMTLCDAKADIHTDVNNQYTLANGCITEFYVDYSCFNSRAKSAGNISVLPGFEGSIVKIEKIVGINVFNLN